MVSTRISYIRWHAYMHIVAYLLKAYVHAYMHTYMHAGTSIYIPVVEEVKIVDVVDAFTFSIDAKRRDCDVTDTAFEPRANPRWRHCAGPGCYHWTKQRNSSFRCILLRCSHWFHFSQNHQRMKSAIWRNCKCLYRISLPCTEIYLQDDTQVWQWDHGQIKDRRSIFRRVTNLSQCSTKVVESSCLGQDIFNNPNKTAHQKEHCWTSFSDCNINQCFLVKHSVPSVDRHLHSAADE